LSDEGATIVLAEIEVEESEYRRFIDLLGLEKCDLRQATAFTVDSRWWEDVAFDEADVYGNTDASNQLFVSRQGHYMYVQRVFHRPPIGDRLE
jgi:hypothetical protein